MTQYTNLTSSLVYKIKLDEGSAASDVVLITKVLDFSDTGISKVVKNHRVTGDTAISTVQWGVETEVTLKLALEDDAIGDDSMSAIVNSFSDMVEDGTTTGLFGYNESQNKTFRVAVQWSAGSNTYMKIYYNMITTSVKYDNSESPEVTITFLVPLMDITTGNSNYYEYEGTAASSVLVSTDANMQWGE